jgi:hypothetical protein
MSNNRINDSLWAISDEEYIERMVVIKKEVHEHEVFIKQYFEELEDGCHSYNSVMDQLQTRYNNQEKAFYKMRNEQKTLLIKRKKELENSGDKYKKMATELETKYMNQKEGLDRMCNVVLCTLNQMSEIRSIHKETIDDIEARTNFHFDEIITLKKRCIAQKG